MNRLPLALVLIAGVGAIAAGFWGLSSSERDRSFLMTSERGNRELPATQPVQRDSNGKGGEPRVSSPVHKTPEADFSIQDFNSRFDLALGMDLKQRLDALSLLVLQASASGSGGHALSKVLTSFGPGRERGHLVGVCFSGIKDPSLMESLFVSLSHAADIESAKDGLISNALTDLSSGDPMDLSRLEKFRFAMESGGFLADLSYAILKDKYYFDGKAIGLDFGVLFASVSEIGLSREDQSNLLLKFSELCPFECWEVYSCLSDKDDKASMKIVDTMARRDPEATSKMLAVNGERGAFLGRAFQKWLELDSRRPQEWLEHNQDRLPDQNADWARMGLLQFQLSSNPKEFGNLREILSNIEDESIRKRGEGAIWSKEREILRKEVQADPAGSLETIVSGQSQFSSYWLEEAVNTWASKDLDAAQNWYEENGNSLPKEKAQYVAAAFATQAIGAGEVDIARQWSALIQDAKTKARIEAAITKAVAGQ